MKYSAQRLAKRHESETAQLRVFASGQGGLWQSIHHFSEVDDVGMAVRVFERRTMLSYCSPLAW